MQFPWRDYVWLVLLLSLAIGLAVEQSRVQKFAACRDQIASQERTARELADQICSLTKTTTQLTEFKDILFLEPGRATLAYHVWIKGWKHTDENVGMRWSAGTDLSFSLIALLLIVPSCFAAFRPGGDYKPGDRVWRDTFLFNGSCQILFVTTVSILLYGSIWIFSRGGSKPLTASLCLTTGVALLNRYVYLGALGRDELENLALRIGGRLLDPTELRDWFRFRLRDICWLMLVIGLACAVYLENQRARKLSKHRGQAQWWTNAAESLRREKAHLHTLFPYADRR